MIGARTKATFWPREDSGTQQSLPDSSHESVGIQGAERMSDDSGWPCAALQNIKRLDRALNFRPSRHSELSDLDRL